MNAKWHMTSTGNGVNIIYHNMVDNILFNCGTASKSAVLQDLIDFALNEGGDAGDCIYLDGQLVCEILINKEYNNGTKLRAECNN
jgi:hypothetical protein